VGHRIIAPVLLSLLVLSRRAWSAARRPRRQAPNLRRPSKPFPEGTATDWCDQFYKNPDDRGRQTTRSQLLTLFGRPDPERSTGTSLAWLYPELWPCMEPESEQLVFKPVVGTAGPSQR
jgi:hypothetical protein